MLFVLFGGPVSRVVGEVAHVAAGGLAAVVAVFAFVVTVRVDVGSVGQLVERTILL